ncbi:tyrosine-protein kinase BAZ1B-like isoform X3 [Branchiostoma floridae x Branchiostoma belcheri]
MPLLGNRQFSLVKPLKDLGPDEMVFVIDHTKEAFRSKEEYLRRLQQYNQSVWTCQCTGNSNLTHEEATQSEQEAYQSLQKEFPECFKQPVLELVHHSTQPLEVLADAAHNKLLTELAMGEKVELKMKIGGKGVQGKVVKVTTPTPEEASSNCSSPSSDKENATGKGTSGTPKKSSLLPYKYNVRIAGEAKVISLIPAVDLHRVERIPSREFVQLFIRSYAMRSGQGPNSPWVVDEECVKKYNLPSKFSDFLVSPKRVVPPNPVSPFVNLGKRKSLDSSESSAKKRKQDKGLTQPKVGLEAFLKPKVKVISSPLKKVSNGPVSPSAKSPPPSPKVIAVNGVGKTPASPKTPKSPKTEKVKAEKKSTAKKPAVTSAKKKATIPEKKRTPKSATKKKAVSSTDSEDDAPLSRYILIEKKKKKTPTKQSSSSDEITIESSDDDIPLNELKRKSLSDSSSPTKKARKSPKKQTAKEKASAAKKSPKKTPGGKKALKQMTLFDLKKKKGESGTPKKGSPKKATTPKKSGTPKKQPGTPKSPWQPAMIKKLVKMKKGVTTPSDQTSDKRSKYGYLLWKVCKEFPVAVLKNAPLEVRAEILEKHKKLKEKERFKKMSEAEKAQFLEQKKEERKKELEKKKEERKKQREEEKKKEKEEKSKRFEDQELKLKALPQPVPVPMPEGLPNTLFGEVAMVVEFISCYYQLLMPEDNYPVTTDAIMKALVAGGEGFAYLARVLVILLQTLLQDDIMEDHKEVGVALGDIPVTMHSASELVRLCLKKHEEEEEEEEEESDEEDEEKIRDVDEVSEELLEKLETTEFHELEPQEKLEILVALTHKVMMSYAVEDHIQEKQQKAAELWKEKIQVLKERKVKRKEEKQKKKDKGDGEDKKEGEKEKKGSKKKDEDKKEEEPEVPMEDDGDLASIVRRRRVLAAQAQKEKAEREKRDREEREKEMEKMRKEREEQSFKTRFEEGIAQARRTLRWQHVGTDRHHNKYWLFSPQTPGLYVEKGWAHESMGYQVTLPNSPLKKKSQQEEEEEEESDVESVSEVQSVTSEASTVRSERVKKHRGVEKTHPPLGQNLWFLYSKKDEVDKLMQNLGTQGIRESQLKEELEKRYQDIKSSLNNYSKRSQQLRSSDGDQELLDAYKRDLEEIETKLEKGGLGGVENPAKWLKRLEKTDKMSELGSLLVEVQAGVLQKFLKGMMAPQKKKPKEPKTEEDDKEENKEEEKDEQEEEENEEEEDDDEEKEVQLYEPREVESWRQATAECSTMSRLHVLMGILDACIKWDKSAENAKCKVCRKKREEDRLLLCDECNQAYHIFCLRPALSCVPPGEWRCPACIPRQARVGSRGRNYREMDEGDYNSSDDDEDKPRTRRGGRSRREQEIVHREECVVCYEEGELVPCSTCPLVFHKECHIPALRNFPRGNNWVCCACQSPAKYRQLRKAKPSQPPPKQQPTRQTSRQTSTSWQAAASSTSPGTSSQSTNQGRASTQSANQGRSTAASRRAQQPVPNNKKEKEELHSRRTNNELKTCEDILQKLMRNKSSVYFRKPVDVEDVPDYYEVIKNPMDLTTVKNKCVCLDYCSPQEFINDVSCIFDNAHEYNKLGSDIREKADTLEKYFLELLEEFLPSYDYPHKETAAIHGMHNDHSYTSPQKSTSNGK